MSDRIKLRGRFFLDPTSTSTTNYILLAIYERLWWVGFFVVVSLLLLARCSRAEAGNYWEEPGGGNYWDQPGIVYQDTGRPAPPANQPAFKPFPPLPPLGASSCDMVRMCNPQGSCTWVSVCQ